jgi:hypothetical protein
VGNVEKVSELLKEISLPQLNKNCGIFCNSANRKKNVAIEVCNVKSQWTESFRIEILQSDFQEDLK